LVLGSSNYFAIQDFNAFLYNFRKDQRRGAITNRRTEYQSFEFRERTRNGFPNACCQHSFDHLVRPVQHGLRNREADLLRGLEIDDKLELHRLLHGQVSRLRAFEDLVHVDGGATI